MTQLAPAIPRGGSTVSHFVPLDSREALAAVTVDTSCFQKGMSTLNYHFLKLLIWKSRSGSHYHHYIDDNDKADEMTSKAHYNDDHILAELTNDEILDALDVLEKIKRNQHHVKQLSDREVASFSLRRSSLCQTFLSKRFISIVSNSSFFS